MERRDDDTGMGGAQRPFPATLWTAVLSAKDPASPHRREALHKLIQAYWKPVYLFVRRRGHPVETSKDLTQGFFAALLEKIYLRYVDRDRGRFRTFLLTALQHFMADEHDRETARKRGGRNPLLSLDFVRAESEVGYEPAGGETPEQAFRRDWALRVLAQALQKLRADFESAGRADEFEALRIHLNCESEETPSYAQVARSLGLTEGEVRNRLYRTRIRYREAILDIVRSYTETEEDAQEELRDLLSAFS